MSGNVQGLQQMVGSVLGSADFSLLDSLDSGAVVLDSRHTVRHWNDWMAQVSAIGPQDLLGRILWEALPKSTTHRLRDVVEDCIAHGIPARLTASIHDSIFPLRHGNGRPLRHDVVVRRLAQGPEPLCLIQVHDITTRWEAQDALHRNELRTRAQLTEIEAIYRTAPIGLGLFDRDMRFLRINEALADMNGVPIDQHLGRCAWDILPMLRPVAEPLFLTVFETGEPLLGQEIRGTTPRAPAVERIWMEDFYPLKAGDGAVVAVGVIVREVTDQRRLEDRERLLTSELHHRVKNLFVMVRALAGQTARGTTTIPDFLRMFEGRLSALAAAQEMLVLAGDTGFVPLRHTMHTALAPFVGDGDRLFMDIPDADIPSKLAADLALALHELATNATKYGALAEQGGQVALSGRVDGSGDGPDLTLEWLETGGPAVHPPDRGGFGTRLLASIVGGHNGRMEMEWLPSGVVCSLRFPLDRAPVRG